MKNSISHILSFISTILLVILVFFVFIEFNFRNKILIRELNHINYYDNVYNTVISKMDNFIVNNEVKEEYKKYISKNLIKADINSIIVNKKFEITRFNDFYEIISKYSDDEEICNKYAKEIDSIYINNIFPINEYKILNKLYVKTMDLIIYSLMLGGIIVFLNFIVFIINNNLNYNKISLLASGIIMLLPNIFINITKVFDNLIYTNDYYTRLLTDIIGNIKNYLFIFGLIIVAVISFFEFKRNKK